jgi:membrane-bound lytic murein transglycosylase B
VGCGRAADRLRRACLALGLALVVGPLAAASAPEPEFEVWLAGLEAEARERGISEATLDAALAGVEPLPRVLELDRNQPEGPGDFCRYLERRLTPTRVARGQKVLEEHAELLREVSEVYGVPARYLIALWGLETNFGDYQGEFPVVPALVTLAHDARRAEYFRGEVLAALRILDEGHRPVEDFRGSWAGATGHVQFMPSTFLAYAVDHDGDGRKDLWSSLPDALASAANYLRRAGWRAGEMWGRPVELPPELAEDAARLGNTRPLDQWQLLGVRDLDGGALPGANLHGRIVLPMRAGGPAYLVYRNYGAFLAWNRSTFFAVSVGTLADAIDGRDSLAPCGLHGHS